MKVLKGQEASIAYRLWREADTETIVGQATAEKPFRFVLGAN